MCVTPSIGVAWLGLAWLGLAWLGLAWLGLAWCAVWYGVSWYLLITACCRVTWRGVAWRGVVFVDNENHSNLASLTPHGGLHIEARFPVGIGIIASFLFLMCNQMFTFFFFFFLFLSSFPIVFFPTRARNQYDATRQESNKVTTTREEKTREGGGT